MRSVIFFFFFSVSCFRSLRCLVFGLELSDGAVRPIWNHVGKINPIPRSIDLSYVLCLLPTDSMMQIGLRLTSMRRWHKSCKIFRFILVQFFVLFQIEKKKIKYFHSSFLLSFRTFFLFFFSSFSISHLTFIFPSSHPFFFSLSFLSFLTLPLLSLPSSCLFLRWYFLLPAYSFFFFIFLSFLTFIISVSHFTLFFYLSSCFLRSGFLL